MRTTIEITDEQRARLLQLAASRGEKGFSALVREAIDLLLEREAARADELEAARELRGTLSEQEAEELRARCDGIRRSWRS